MIEATKHWQCLLVFPWEQQARSIENPHQGPRFSHQRSYWLPMHHPIASNRIGSKQQLRKPSDASSMLHPKWSYQLYTPTRPLSFVVWCCKSIHRANQLESWILNLEWAVLPPKSNKDAIPDEATINTILPCPCRWDRSIVQTNVLLVPPLLYTKNSLPFLFVTTFKIVSYALR